MPSIVGPGVGGGMAQSVVEGLLRGWGLARQGELDTREAEAQRRISALRDLQIATGQHEAEQRALVQSVVPQIMAAPTAPVELAPSMPPRLAGSVVPGEDVEAQAYIPRTPGQPGVTKPMLTMEDLAKQPGVGPQGLAAAVASPQGRAALTARSVVTAKEVEELRRRETGLQGFRDHLQESFEKARAGDALGSLLADRAAFMALAEGSADPARAMERAVAAKDEYLKLVQKPKEIEAAGRDIQRFAQLIDALNTKRDEESLAAVLAGVAKFETEVGQKKALETMGQAAQGKLAQVKNAGFVAVNQRAAQIWSDAMKGGQRMDWTAALAQAMKADPASFAKAIGQLESEGKKRPDDWTMAMFGYMPDAKDEALAQQAARAAGLQPGTPQYYEEVFRRMKSLKVEPRERTTENLIALRGQAITEVQGLKREMKDPSTEADRRDEIMARLRYLEGDPATKTEGMLGYYDRQINAAMGGGAPATGTSPRKPALEAPPTPQAPKVEARKPVTALKGDRLKAATTAELQRLIGLGMTKAQAAEEMRRKGWQ